MQYIGISSSFDNSFGIADVYHSDFAILPEIASFFNLIMKRPLDHAEDFSISDIHVFGVMAVKSTQSGDWFSH